MDDPLWTKTYEPTIDDLPQPAVRSFLERAITEPMNLLLYGPPGVGKTAAVRALAREAHDSLDDLVIINVSDFFGSTKRELRDDPRFSPFISPQRARESSKAALINHVLREVASYPPVTGDYKTILLDNAEHLREDFQQALRRVMERHHVATQFVITTRRPSGLIDPLLSRCVPLRIRSPANDEIVSILDSIVSAESVDATDDGLEYVAGYANGNLRAAILGAQTIATTSDAITMETAYSILGEVGADDRIRAMVAAGSAGEFLEARSILDELLIDEGFDGSVVLRDVMRLARSRFSSTELARLHELAGDVDAKRSAGINDRIHLSRFLAELPAIDHSA